MAGVGAGEIADFARNRDPANVAFDKMLDAAGKRTHRQRPIDGFGGFSLSRFLDKKVNGRRVKVEVSIFKRYKKQLTQDVRFSIKSEGILGEKLVEIHSDDSGVLVDLSQPVIGEDALNVQDLAQVFSSAAESFTKTSQDFSKVDVVKLSKVLEETAQSLVVTSKGINAILTELNYISIKSKRLLDRLEQKIIDGDLFKVF